MLFEVCVEDLFGVFIYIDLIGVCLGYLIGVYFIFIDLVGVCLGYLIGVIILIWFTGDDGVAFGFIFLLPSTLLLSN